MLFVYGGTGVLHEQPENRRVARFLHRFPNQEIIAVYQFEVDEKTKTIDTSQISLKAEVVYSNPERKGGGYEERAGLLKKNNM